MGLTCNIDRTGRTIRILVGLLLTLDGVLLYIFGFPGSGVSSHLLQGLLVAVGLFCVFEGMVGWCAVRAMGIRTKF